MGSAVAPPFCDNGLSVSDLSGELVVPPFGSIACMAAWRREPGMLGLGLRCGVRMGGEGVRTLNWGEFLDRLRGASLSMASASVSEIA